MTLRLGFAVASSLSPTLMIVDEVLTVGDASFQRKCLARIEELRGSGMALLVASHDLATLERLCERVLQLREGAPVRLGPAGEVCRAYVEDLG